MSIIKDIFSVSRKTFFNPSGWVGAEGISRLTMNLSDILKVLFSKPVAGQAESFEEAMKRMQLSEPEIIQRAITYRYYAFFFAFVGLLALFHGFFLLFRYSSFTGWLISLGVTALFFSQAFKYDFWSFQMRRRKLGLSFSDYKKFILDDEDNA